MRRRKFLETRLFFFFIMQYYAIFIKVIFIEKLYAFMTPNFYAHNYITDLLLRRCKCTFSMFPSYC